MKLHYTLLMLLIPGSICAAAKSSKSKVAQPERRLVLEEHPTAMLFGVVQKAWADATTTIPEPSGMVPGIYKEILEKGYLGFCATNRAVVKRTFEILDHFEPGAQCSCCSTPIQLLMQNVGAVFADAKNKSEPEWSQKWTTECDGFSAALMLMAKQNPLSSKFKVRVMTLDRIIANNGIEGTPEERIEIAAHMLAVTARFNARFVAMDKNPEKFAAFCQLLPEIFKSLKARGLEN